MKEIKLIESCFGPDVIIDDESIFIHEYDNRDPKFVEGLRKKLLDKLIDIQDQLDMSDWTDICEVIIKHYGFELDYDNSKYSKSCDQCGNYNHTHIYNKLEDEKEL